MIFILKLVLSHLTHLCAFTKYHYTSFSTISTANCLLYWVDANFSSVVAAFWKPSRKEGFKGHVTWKRHLGALAVSIIKHVGIGHNFHKNLSTIDHFTSKPLCILTCIMDKHWLRSYAHFNIKGGMIRMILLINVVLCLLGHFISRQLICPEEILTLCNTSHHSHLHR